MTAPIYVIGAGAIGLACAWQLAQRGLAVYVVDQAPDFTTSASAAAAGFLSATCPPQPSALQRFHYTSQQLFGGFAANLTQASGYDLAYNKTGHLKFFTPDQDPHQDDTGWQPLPPTLQQSCHKFLPLGGEAGYFNPASATVAPLALLQALIIAAERSGAQFHWQTTASWGPDGILQLNQQPTEAGAVVIAAGYASLRLLGGVEVTSKSLYPLRPKTGLALRYRVPAAQQPPLPLTYKHYYAIPRPRENEVYFGASNQWGEVALPSAVADLTQVAAQWFPWLLKYAVTDEVRGVRAVPAKPGPYLGRVGAGPGHNTPVYLATGHGSGGVKSAPLTAYIIQRLICQESMPKEWAEWVL